MFVYPALGAVGPNYFMERGHMKSDTLSHSPKRSTPIDRLHTGEAKIRIFTVPVGDKQEPRTDALWETRHPDASSMHDQPLLERISFYRNYDFISNVQCFEKWVSTCVSSCIHAAQSAQTKGLVDSWVSFRSKTQMKTVLAHGKIAILANATKSSQTRFWWIDAIVLHHVMHLGGISYQSMIALTFSEKLQL